MPHRRLRQYRLVHVCSDGTQTHYNDADFQETVASLCDQILTALRNRKERGDATAAGELLIVDQHNGNVVVGSHQI